MAACCKKGLCLTREGVTPEGKAISVRLVAWSLEEHGPLHWDLARVLQELLRYEVKSVGTMPHRRLKDLRPRWTQLAHMLQAHLHELLFIGPHSWLVRNQLPPATVDCSSSMATSLVWAALCDSAVHRNPKQLRSEVEHHATLFAESCLTCGDAVQVLAMLHNTSPEHISLCSFCQNHIGHCGHIRQVFAAAESGHTRSPQHGVFKFMSLLHQHSDDCMAAQSKSVPLLMRLLA